MEFNKSLLYLKIFLLAIVVGWGYMMSNTIWAKFKDWAMGRKATKMIAIIETNFCIGDAGCSETLGKKKEECTELVTKNRVNKDAPDFAHQDRRLAIGCMHRPFMEHMCSKRSTDKKKEDCAGRVAKSHTKCFEYVYTPEMTEVPKGMGANMVGCLYGVIFVQDDSAGPGISVEEVNTKKKPKLSVKAIDLNQGLPSISDIKELKEQLAEIGEARLDNFNEAMDALQGMRGGAAMENTAEVDVMDKSGESAMKSAGIGRAEPDPSQAVERVPAME